MNREFDMEILIRDYEIYVYGADDGVLYSIFRNGSSVLDGFIEDREVNESISDIMEVLEGLEEII